MFKFKNNYRAESFAFSSIVHPRSGQYFISNFTKNIDEIVAFFESVDSLPEPSTESLDYVSLLVSAYKILSLRRSIKKSIIWIGSRPAKGNRFCGEEGNENEEEELTYLLRKLSQENYRFDCLFLDERAKNTFLEMRSIYRECGNKFFSIRDFDKSDDQFDDDGITRYTPSRHSVLSDDFNI